tara:strand:- start:605 stop:1375 length:771 start_codon:yes stop_codon:yes gene_type:complete
MNINTKKKGLLRANKDLVKLVNECNLLEETSIIFFGDLKDDFFLILKKSLEKALALKSQLPNWIINLNGLSGRKFRYFLNNLIFLFPDAKYLEIGSWLGSTACSACYGNKLHILCIDNWSEFLEFENNPKKIFNDNIKKCTNKSVNLEIIENDFKLINYEILKKFNIYFYDGSHHFKDHFDAVCLVQDCLDNKYILIVDDWNWKQVREGTYKGIKEKKLKIISGIEIKTTQDDSKALIDGKHSEWHNGYGIFIVEK